MSRVRGPRKLGWIMLGVSSLTLCVIVVFSCTKLPPAPDANQAVIVLSANPTTVQPGTGTSDITAIGTKISGAAIWDHTQITLSTDNGHIEPATAEFLNGRATARYFASSLRGTAKINATSGRVEISSIDILVGGGASSLILSASRTSLPARGGRVVLRAAVYDESDNPLPRLPVTFTASHGSLGSSGRPIMTGSDGVARDSLTTDADATVTASSGGLSGTLDIKVVPLPDNMLPEAKFQFSPSEPTVDAVVFFNGQESTDSDGRVVKWLWDFGDGASGTGQKARHTYTAIGTWRVVLCVVDNRGARGCTEVDVTVTEGT